MIEMKYIYKKNLIFGVSIHHSHLHFTLFDFHFRHFAADWRTSDQENQKIKGNTFL